MASPIAHISAERRHDLVQHLEESAEKAGAFASVWGSDRAAALAGRLHDLGKFLPAFQAKLEAAGENGHLETAGKPVIHAYAGADLLLRDVPKPLGPLLSMVVAGHHGGLPDWDGGKLEQAISGHLERVRTGRPPQDLLAPSADISGPGEGVDAGLWTRMTASAVYDSDFLDTEGFFNPEKQRDRTGWADIKTLAQRFHANLPAYLNQAERRPMDALRAEVLATCRAKAALPPGLFSLTVPTGGGKTLSALAFALKHAETWGLRRVVYAVPFTSIVEQTAQVFRDVLGEDAVLEHHSALDLDGLDERSGRARLACENWDAPVVVTTNVQVFESLFASRTSRLRKLHNLAGSVLILDEAQALPPAYLRPITVVLDQLARHFRVSIVLCTATQPALTSVFRELPPPVEIMDDPAALFSRLERFTTHMPAAGETLSWDAVARRMAAVPQALAIANTRAGCRALFEFLPAGAYHLSTRQCPAHRRDLLEEIKRRLKDGKEVRVAATSLVEAGVDFSFPLVLRAMAGLDSLAQAAGRCNRHGDPDLGRFEVFIPQEGDTRPDLPQAVAATRAALRRWSGAPFTPEAFRTYFDDLYWSKGEDALDSKNILGLLRLPMTNGGRRRGDPYNIQFRTAARAFRMIEDEGRVDLVVPYGEAGATAIAQWRSSGPGRFALRALQPFTVQVRLPDLPPKSWEMVHGLPVLLDETLYRKDVGLEVAGGA